MHLVKSKAQKWNSEKYVQVPNIGQCGKAAWVMQWRITNS